MYEQNVNTGSVEKEFDEIASTYETNRLSLWYKVHGEMILNDLDPPQNGAILDIGCGTGWLLRQIVKLHQHIKGIGIDISSKMIDIAKEETCRENINNLAFIKGDWEELDLSMLKQENIKTIVCANTFHYFTDPVRAAKRMSQTLMEGGKFSLLERDKANSILTHTWGVLHRFLIRDHVRFYLSSELIQFFESAGFADVSIKRRVRKVFWKRKFYTSQVLISGKKTVRI